MPVHPKSDESSSALSVLTELAVEGASSLVESQRTLLELAQQENDLVLKGLKQKVSSLAPAAAMTDFVRRSLNTLVEMQQDLLTTGSKQMVTWLQSGTTVSDHTGHLIESAREAVEAFGRAQKKFLEAVSEESSKALSGGPSDETLSSEPVDLKQLGRDAANAFIEAQKKLLEIMGQQVNVNLKVATQASDLISPAQVAPAAALAIDSVRSFFDAESALVDSLTKAQKQKPGQGKKAARRTVRRRERVAV